MIDCYAHLPHPFMTGGLLVEKWDGSNRELLESMERIGLPHYRYAFCYRGSIEALERPLVVALRVKTADMGYVPSFDKWLLPHAEDGPATMAAKLTDRPTYVPHLCLPGPGWEEAISHLVRIQTLVIGVSSLSSFDHAVTAAHALADALPHAQFVAGSDSPGAPAGHLEIAEGLARSLSPQRSAFYDLFT